MERRKSTWHVFWTESLQDLRTNGWLWGMKEGYALRTTSRHWLEGIWWCYLDKIED